MHFPLCCASADLKQRLLSIWQSAANAVSDTMGIKFFPFTAKGISVHRKATKKWP